MQVKAGTENITAVVSWWRHRWSKCNEIHPIRYNKFVFVFVHVFVFVFVFVFVLCLYVFLYVVE